MKRPVDREAHANSGTSILARSRNSRSCDSFALSSPPCEMFAYTIPGTAFAAPSMRSGEGSTTSTRRDFT